MNDRKRKLEIIKTSGIFDSDWYKAKYPDVVILKMDPIVHFVEVGELLLRDPGPSFSLRRYLEAHPDAAKAELGPVAHFIENANKIDDMRPREQNRAVVSPTSASLKSFAAAKLAAAPKRFLDAFDKRQEASFLSEIQKFYDDTKFEIDGRLVSIVMPTFNRRPVIEAAIRSVLAQSHQNWELLITDDGSDDGTAEYIFKNFSDPRVKIFQEERGGVSRARNVSLKHARGSFIFFLDSDNTWRPDFLRTMLTYLIAADVDCAYSAAEVVSGGKTVGFRGEPFSWDECLKANYVDMNVFAIRAELFKVNGFFDEKLRRMVDWDFILRYTKDSQPAFAPFIGCHYLDDKADKNRISVAQPYAYRAVVQVKNSRNVQLEQVKSHLRYVISIKIPAPYEKRAEWGDYHYANSLKKCLEKLGHSVRIDFLGQWYDKPINHDHVVIVIRGLTKYEPRAGEINILWNISHPDQVMFQEYEKFDIIYVASLSFPALLNSMLDGKVKSLLQCSDSNIFAPRGQLVPSLEGLIFVGNSRNQYRPMVKWSVEAGERIRVFGTKWTQYIDSEHLKGENINNRELAEYYNGQEVVLNDHWASMKDFGFISNRLFDIVSAGGVALSDDIPSMKYLFDGVVRTADDSFAFRERLEELRDQPPPVSKRLEMSAFVRQHHSFDARASEIVSDIGDHLGISQATRSPTSTLYRAPWRRKAGLLLQRGKAWPTSSGFIRLLAPLTADAAFGSFETVILDGPDDPQLSACDICIVQRVAIGSHEVAEKLIRLLDVRGIPLFVDNDDALSLLPEHSEADAVMRQMMSAAKEVWFSTEPLISLYGDSAPNGVLLKNCLDPRLWRNYRPTPRQKSEVVEILYMGTATHDRDFEIALPGLDALNQKRPGSFRLTLIGAVRKPPTRPWITVLQPPSDIGAYPRFVHWLRQQGPFHIGIAPLADTEFNGYKSDIKFLDYTAIGLAVVASRCPAYNDSLGLGLAIGAGKGDWCDALESLWEEEPRRKIVEMASEYLWSERNALTVGQALAARILAHANMVA